MSTEIKNTLFRFVTMRAPELSNEENQNLRFIFRPAFTAPNTASYFADASSSANKLETLKALAQDFIPNAMLASSLKTFLSNDLLGLDLYNFSIWVAKNKNGFRKTELATKITPAKAIWDMITDKEIKKSVLWDNIFYQVVTHKDFYAKEIAMQLLHAIHVIENFDALNDVQNTLVMKSRVVLPKEYFVDEVVEETNTPFSTLSTTPKVVLLPNRIMQKQHAIAFAEHENGVLEKLKTDFKKVQKIYKKEHAAALKIAEAGYQATIKPILDAHNLAVEESLQTWCSVRDPQLEYNAEDPCSKPPVVPDPVLPVFSFEHTDEMDPAFLEANLPAESYTLFTTLTDEETLMARGSQIIGLETDGKSLLTDVDTIENTIASIDFNRNRNNQLIVENTLSNSNALASIGGILIPISNHNAIVNPFDFELSTNTFITGEQRAMFSFEVPDSSWDMESLSYMLEKDTTTYANVISQSRKIGNHIIIKSLPLGNALKEDEGNIGAFSGEIIFTNGTKKIFTVGDYNFSSVFTGQLTNESDIEIEDNDGFVPAGFGMKQLGIADYKKVEQSVHCYIEGEVAHIENIMAREYKEKSTRRLRKSENTTTSSSESEREQLTDTTSTERYDMQSEVAKVIQQANDFSAGTQFVANGYKVNFSGHADFATHNSKEESTRQSVTQAKEITEKALDRIINKVKEERIEKIVEEYEENNKHGFDNTKGDNHVVGVYRWVDKLYKNKIVNYGKRLMFEFMIPQPAKLHTLGMDEIASIQVEKLTAPDDPRTFDLKNTRFPGLLNLKDFSKVNETTLRYWASRYNVDIINMPTTSLSVGKEFSFDSLQRGETSMSWSGKESLTIPDGYKAADATVSVSGAAMSGGSWAPYLGASVGNLKFYRNYGVNENANLAKQGDETLEHYEKSIPVSVFAITQHVGIFNVSVKCELTEEARKNWQQETFKSIIDAYEDALATFKEKEASEKQKAATIKDTNPGFYRQIENTILRKNCISYMIDRRAGAKKAYGQNMSSGSTFGDYEINLNKNLDNYAAFAKFMEQAFEWDIMSYSFYPYYWGARADWSAMYQFDETNDPLFRNFMQSGMARVVTTVRPGFEDAVRYFLQTGKIWNGGEVPLIEDELFLSIVEELDEQEGQQEGKAWITRLPTSLTILQADSIGLTVEKALPCNCEDEINEETYENPEDALCSDNFEIKEGQTLTGVDTLLKTQNNITRVVNVAYQDSAPNTITKVLNAINNGVPYPVAFTILEDEDYIITASPQFSPSVEGYVAPVFKYKVVNLGKNKTGEHYGFGGIQLTAENLELIYSNEAAVNDYLDNPSTQLVDLGWDITGTTISDFVNLLEEPIMFQEQEDGYVIVKVTNNNEPRKYFFTGQGGSYGANAIQAQETDFQLLQNDSESNNSATISTLPPSGIPADGQEWIIYNDNI